jgi:hypothetical protein
MKLKNLFFDCLIALLGITLSFCLFALGDFLYSLNKKPILEKDFGWYELKKNFDGNDKWGEKSYRIKTDSHGFRINPEKKKEGQADLIFLGDSFTYGINGSWSDTFVGMYDNYTEKIVVNAGTSSYSPTAYLYQYKKAINENVLKKNHIVVIGLDISDVQDEAGYWIDGPSHPIKREYLNSKMKIFDLRKFIRDHFVLTSSIFSFISHSIDPKPDPFLQERMSVRSAFTWRNWRDLDTKLPLDGVGGYAPLGVSGGLLKIRQKIEEISKIAKKTNSKVYILIYPWPAQIQFVDAFDWTSFASKLCADIKCAGLIDAKNSFVNYSQSHSDWYEKFFLKGDVHYSREGNNLVFLTLKNKLKR